MSLSLKEAAQLAPSELLAQLNSRTEGLTTEESASRFRVPKNNAWGDITILLSPLWRQIKSPLVLILVCAATLSMILGERVDGSVIFGILALNTVIGFVQEFHSAQLLKNLQKYVPQLVTVKRAGEASAVAIEQVVVGDIAILNAGDIVAADIRLLALEGLSIDESILTGESVPVTKTLALDTTANPLWPRNCVWAGTKITGGSGVGVTVAVGSDTYLSQLGTKAKSIERPSLFEENIKSFSRLLMWIVIVSMTILFLVSLILNHGHVDIVTQSLFIVALALGILPEALPVVTTITLSRGAARLAKQSVVVKRLSAVEDFGNIDVLCTDKTGTITENNLKIQQVESALTKEELLKISYLSHENTNHNPFDQAVAAELSATTRHHLDIMERIQEIPFDAFRKRSSWVVSNKDELTLITRGAPEELLLQCTSVAEKTEHVTLTTSKRHEYLDLIAKLSNHGLRTLGVAQKTVAPQDHYDMKDEVGLTWVGLIAFTDPLRASTKSALTMAEHLGLRVKILTGDHAEVARAVAIEAGIITAHDDILTSEEISTLDDEALTSKLDTIDVFARVSPDDKFRIIKLLQQQGKKVAYMGDGVNDVPALAEAEVSIAAPNATAVAKATADVVLLKRDLHVLVNGLHEGRKIFANITKYLKYSLGGNVGNFFSLAIISLFSPILPQLPTQILLGNFISDIPLLAIGWDTIDPKEVRRPQNYLLSAILRGALGFAIISAVFDFIFFGLFWHLPPDLLRTLWFMESMLTEIFLLFSVRSLNSALHRPFPHRLLIGMALVGIATCIILPYVSWGRLFYFVPPPMHLLITVILLSFGYLLANEGLKWIWRIKRS